MFFVNLTDLASPWKPTSVFMTVFPERFNEGGEAHLEWGHQNPKSLSSELNGKEKVG